MNTSASIKITTASDEICRTLNLVEKILSETLGNDSLLAEYASEVEVRGKIIFICY